MTRDISKYSENALWFDPKKRKIVEIIGFHRQDGALLIVESRDEIGDTISGDIYNTDTDLILCTEEHWNEVYRQDGHDWGEGPLAWSEVCDNQIPIDA